MNKLDLTKPIKTRDGRDVIILKMDANVFYHEIKQPIIGLITEKDGTQFLSCWGIDGNWLVDTKNDNDLVNVKEKKTLTTVVALCQNSSGECYSLNQSSLEALKAWCALFSQKLISYKEVTFEYED